MEPVNRDRHEYVLPQEPAPVEDVKLLTMDEGLFDIGNAGFMNFISAEDDPLYKQKYTEHPNAKYIVHLNPKPEKPRKVEGAKVKDNTKPFIAKEFKPDNMVGFKDGKIIATEKGREKFKQTVFQLNGKLIPASQLIKEKFKINKVEDIEVVTHENFIELYRLHLIAMNTLKKNDKAKEESADQTKVGQGQQVDNLKKSLKSKSKIEKISVDGLGDKKNKTNFEMAVLMVNKTIERFWKKEERQEKVDKQLTAEEDRVTKDAQKHAKVNSELVGEAQGLKGTPFQQETENQTPIGKENSSESVVEKRLKTEQHRGASPNI